MSTLGIKTLNLIQPVLLHLLLHLHLPLPFHHYLLLHLHLYLHPHLLLLLHLLHLTDQFSIIDPPDSPLDLDPSTDQHDAGIPIILPSSFMSSPRNMNEAYYDAMAVVRNLGGTDLFITFTCIERWPEIVNNLKLGQRALPCRALS